MKAQKHLAFARDHTLFKKPLQFQSEKLFYYTYLNKKKPLLAVKTPVLSL